MVLFGSVALVLFFSGAARNSQHFASIIHTGPVTPWLQLDMVRPRLGPGGGGYPAVPAKLALQGKPKGGGFSKFFCRSAQLQGKGDVGSAVVSSSYSSADQENKPSNMDDPEAPAFNGRPGPSNKHPRFGVWGSQSQNLAV